MHLSVVVPTLNGRDRLATCLDALGAEAPGAEVVVVNGPSTDGTTGMVQERTDVNVLLEVPERNVNVARNAGIRAATGDIVALLDDRIRVSPEWRDAVADVLGDGADVVTGPRRRELPAGLTTNEAETETIAGRSVTYFDGGNVAATAGALAAVDGFDEYLQTGGARDAAQRLARCGRTVKWADGMGVRHDLETDGGPRIRADVPRPDVGLDELARDWGWKYRSFTYRLVKNFGLRPAVARRVVRQAADDALAEGTDVFRGESLLSTWAGTGRTVLSAICRGAVDGQQARLADRTPRRNPNGFSVRDDRPVTTYDWRD
jgi:glycosyltransferase involved in cell wall biosynthesis